jgi:hypothetical protein
MGVRTQTMFIALALVAVAVVIFALSQAKADPQPLRWIVLTAFALVLIQGRARRLARHPIKRRDRDFSRHTRPNLFRPRLRHRHHHVGALGAIENRRLRWRLASLSLRVCDGHDFFAAHHRRHYAPSHAGLAIPDFPLAYGGLWPATDAASIETYNQTRVEVSASQLNHGLWSPAANGASP